MAIQKYIVTKYFFGQIEHWRNIVLVFSMSQMFLLTNQAEYSDRFFQDPQILRFQILVLILSFASQFKIIHHDLDPFHINDHLGAGIIIITNKVTNTP